MELKDLKKYQGKKLTTDEIAFVENKRKKLIEELEKLDYERSGEYLLLKWGTLKGWKLNSIKGQKLLQEYQNIGTTASVMLQKDTEKQKNLILQMIDECTGAIQSDWTGEYFTKEQAKKYIIEYGKEN